MTDYTYNTGNPIGSTDVRDGVDNLKSFDTLMNSQDDTYQDRLGNTVPTAAGAIKRLGPVVTAWTFTTGGTLNYPNEAALNPADGNYYGWTGAFPKVVAPGTDPTAVAGYVPRTDVALRDELASSAGVALVGNAADSRGQEFTGRVSAPNMQVGSDPLTGDALRDGAVVSRTNSGATNIHGFADRTRLTAVSDYGGYGAFDSTIAVVSSSDMNHTFSFQHRVAYDGSGGGTIGKIAGLLSSPTIYAGTVEEHTAVRIGNPDIKPGAVLNQNVGIDIGALFGATANVGLKMSVDIPLGYNIYQPGYSKNYLAGAVGINDTEVAYKGEPLRLKGYGVGAQPMSFDTTATEAKIGFAAADSWMKFYTGGELGFQLTPTTTYERAFIPGSDNQQPLGTMPYRWKVVVAGTGTIVTSDERTKAEIRSLSDAEISAGVEIGQARKLYKLRQSIEEKGSDDARWHCGWIAQEVKAIMERHGLDPFRYGFLCHDAWPDELDSSGIVVTPAGERYSLRYDELTCFVSAAKEMM